MVVTLAFSIEQNVRLAVGHDVLGNLLHVGVVEVHPYAMIVGVRCVMSVGCAASVVHDDRSQVVNTARVRPSGLGPTVQDELGEIQRLDGKLNAQVDFLSETEFGVRLRKLGVRLGSYLQ